MNLLLAALMICTPHSYARQNDTYTIDGGGCVTVDRDMKQDDLKMDVVTDDYEMFNAVKGWFE